MSLESTHLARRTADTPRDKPQVERVEHANVERRPAAVLHPPGRMLKSRTPNPPGRLAAERLRLTGVNFA